MSKNMSLCINPNCRNPDTLANQNNMFCQDCGSDLLIHGCYRVVKLIGEGGFAKTYEVLEGGISRVLKILLPCHTSNQKAVELFQQEASILSRLNHSGVPKITSKGCFTFAPRDQQIKHIYCFVMERIAGVDLEIWMENQKGNVIPLDLALNWLQQLVKILDLIHQQQYFHRDIKPSNIMLRPNGQLVLIDFGAAREMTNTYMAKMVRGSVLTSIGSAGYIPPEQANGKGVPQSDFFSLGRTFVYLLTGQTPSNFPESPTTGQMIWHSSAPKIPSLLLEFVDQLMSPFVGNRPKNAQEVLQKLKQIEIDVQKTISVNKIAAVRQSSQKPLNLKYFLWAIPVTSLAVVGYLFSNSLAGRNAKPLQVTESEISPSIPVKAPESKLEVKTQQENNSLAEANSATTVSIKNSPSQISKSPTVNQNLAQSNPPTSIAPLLPSPTLQEQEQVVTLEKFNRIQKGMTVEQVEKNFGVSGKVIAENNSGNSTGQVYSWKNPQGSNAIIEFKDGQVVAKAQAGL